MNRLVDGFGRRFNYLRLSVTEACNFRCTYCLPNGYRKSGPMDLLSVEEIGRLTKAFAHLGVRKVRLTGGEPTVRRDIGDIIACVAQTPGIEKVAMTTNGWNLSRRIADWRAAGLTNLNVSLDSLDADEFRQITGHDRLAAVLGGLDQAVDLGLPSVKVNAVLLRETAERGFAEFAAFVRERPIAVRFIELMRTADNADYFAAHHAGGQVLRDWLAREGWTARARDGDGGPAVEFTHPDHLGRLGLIAPYSAGFCDGCNRLRVTSRGALRLCLFGEGGMDLRDLLIEGAQSALEQRVAEALLGKAAGHRLVEGRPGDLRNLAQLGG